MKKKRLLATVLALTLTAAQILPSMAVTAKAAGALNTNKAEAPAAPEAFGPTPSAGQMKYYKDELAAFLHFGVNTFTGSEWGNGQESPNVFQPTELDTDQWMEVLKAAGFKRAILTTKHHDGFALFPTKYSPNKRSVESSAWRDGKGDVVRDFVDSCAKYDMDIGFYLSPWDVGNPEYPADNGRDYNDIYIGQMQELFEYADSVGKPVTEFWLDGANGGNNRPKYDIQRWWDNLFAHNQDIVFQQNYGAPLRWCGNESGYSADTCWHILDKDYVWNLYDQQGQEDSGYLHVGEPYDPAGGKNYIWSISEVDVSLHSGWFWHNTQTKSALKLIDMYFDSVGLGSPFLLNVPPNKQGLIDPADIAVLEEFRDILDHTFTKNYVTDGTASAEASATRGNNVKYGAENVVDDDYDTYWTMDDGQTTGSVTVMLNKPQLIDVIQIQEYIPLGQRIASFKAEVHSHGQWTEFGKGGTIGYKRLVKGAPVMADAIRVTVTDAKAVPLINDISAFKADERIEEEAKVVPGKIQAESCSQLSGAISENKGPNGGGNLGAVKNGATAEYDNYIFKQIPKSFTLSYSGAGTPQITLRLDSADGPVIAQMTVDNPGGYDKYVMKTVPVTYEGEPITGMHKIVLCMNAGLNVDWFELTGANTMTIAPNKAEVYEGDAFELTVTRSEEDLTEEVKVTVQDVPGSAVQGQDYETITEELIFAPGETAKTVQIQTLKDDKKAEDLKFSIELENPSSNALVAQNAKAAITILDLDAPADKTGLEKVLAKANEKAEEEYMPVSWTEFAKVRDEAQTLMDKENANRKELEAMAAKLNQAMNALTPFRYTEENPLVLPFKAGETLTTEGEYFQLVPKEGAEGNRIQIEAPTWCQCSKGNGVGWWATGDYMTAPAVIRKPGIYTFGFRYGSGSRDDARNTIRISGEGIEATDIVFVPNYPNPSWQYVDVTVTEEALKAGSSIKVEAVANGGPLLDQVSVTLKEAATDAYHVEVKGGAGTGNYEYNTPITVKADAPEDGKVFAGWKLNGQIVATDAEYTFYVSGDMTLKAAYADAETVIREAEAIVTNVITTERDGKYDVKFVGQIVVPEGGKLEEAGLVWSSNKDTALTLEEAKITRITKISNTHQFSVTIKGMPKGRFIRGKIFAKVSGDTRYSSEDVSDPDRMLK